MSMPIHCSFPSAGKSKYMYAHHTRSIVASSCHKFSQLACSFVVNITTQLPTSCTCVCTTPRLNEDKLQLA